MVAVNTSNNKRAATKQTTAKKGGGGDKSGGSNNRDRRNGHVAIQIGQNGAGGSGGNGADRMQRRPKMVMRRVEKPRQEICAPLKWACFIINFVIFLAAVGCLALGLYLYVNDPRPLEELADFVLNPAVVFTTAGLIAGIVALFGLFGALRDNVFLLKLFALCVFLAYLLLVVCTCFLFLLFYSDAIGDTNGISAQSLLLYSIGRYHANKNVADFVDYLQEQMECCGSSTFRDWQHSEQFNCNATNPYPEKCGVPFSCCRRSVVSGAGSGPANQNPLAPAIRSIQCWQNAQKKREQELDSDIYVAGCLQPLRALFDAHALHIGIAVVSVILPVCLGVCLSQCLARQIDYQHFLLRREQRRIERRERRERRYIEQQQQAEQKQRKKASISSQSELIERVVPEIKNNVEQNGGVPRPPKIPPPPTPRNDAEAAALAAAIRASKKDWQDEQRRRHQSARAASFSPLRNCALKRGPANEEANKNGNKRKSMTLDMAERNQQKKKKQQQKEDVKKHKEEEKRNGSKLRAVADNQQQQPRRHSQFLGENAAAFPLPFVAHAFPKKSASNNRLEPTAPPIFLTNPYGLK